MSRIKSLSNANVSDGWSMYHGFNYGSAVLIHDVDTDGEWVTAQYMVDSGELLGSEATPVRRYKLYQTSACASRSYGPTPEPRLYFRMYGWRLYLDEFMWRGGNIAETQKILLDNGTIKI